MRARLKQKLIQASMGMAKTQKYAASTKNPVKPHNFPSGKSRKPERKNLRIDKIEEKKNESNQAAEQE